MWHQKLRGNAERILKVWESETRESLHAATTESRLVLRDALPLFLARLADVLEAGPGALDQHPVGEGHGPVFPSLQSSGTEHGRQRAEQTDYSLQAVLVEYKILRKVIFRILEEDGETLPISVRDSLLDALDAGIEVAGTSFASVTSDLLSSHIRNLELEKGLREVFVSRLTHDLRNPLSAISTASHLLAASPDADLLTRFIPKIISNVRRMDGMVTDLLDANRIHAGQKVALEMGAADLVLSVRGSISDAELVHGARFVYQGPAVAHGFWAIDAVRRVTDNLLSNAVKYGDTEHPITVVVGQSETDAMLSVHNRGTPIPSADLAQIFEAFQRGRLQKNDAASWGIGLSVVKSVIDNHGGTIEVESSEVDGTRFTIRMPNDARGAPRADKTTA